MHSPASPPTRPPARPVALYCDDCGYSVSQHVITCERCGSASIVEAYAAPRHVAAPVRDPLPYPWGTLEQWPEASAVALSGGPGGGKSSLAALIFLHFACTRPAVWCTSEQTIPAAAALIARISSALPAWPQGRRLPPIYPVGSFADLRAACEEHGDCFLVLDSITRIAEWADQVKIADYLCDPRTGWIMGGRDRRLLVIQQINSRGEAAGALEIPHLVHAVSYVEARDGLRVLTVTKNRNGPIGSIYFSLGSTVTIPAFPYAYTVEGEPGSYRLHPFPLPGARWAGLFDLAAKIGSGPAPGTATAALPCASYPGGVLLPADAADRRRFAEAHGLTWIETLSPAEPAASED